MSEEATRLQHEAEERAEAANVDELAERRVAEQAAASEPVGTRYRGAAGGCGRTDGRLRRRELGGLLLDRAFQVEQ